eukprot:278148_1
MIRFRMISRPFPSRNYWRTLETRTPINYQNRCLSTRTFRVNSLHPKIFSNGKSISRLQFYRSSRMFCDYSFINPERAQKNARIVIIVFSGCFVLVGVGFLMVPLYRSLCQAFGWDGSLPEYSQEKLDKLVEYRKNRDITKDRREITVKFLGDTSDLPWEFEPVQKKVKVLTGDTALVFFEAENTSDKAITGVASYNISPPKAAKYFHKVQCFCFEEQRLRPHEKIDMPVLFYIDPEYENNWRLRNVDEIHLAYIFFDRTADYEDEDYEDEDVDMTYTLGPSAFKKGDGDEDEDEEE